MLAKLSSWASAYKAVFDLALHSALHHSALEFAEWQKEEKGREECNSPPGLAAFPVLFFTVQVASNASQIFFFFLFQLSFLATKK